MGLKYDQNDYAIPRGRVYFDPEVGGVNIGEKPLGNCPGVTVQIETTKSDHFSSETGLRQKDASVVVEVNRTGKVTCDNITLENLAYFFSGAVESVTQSSGTVTAESHTVQSGRHYQIGKSSANPAGVRNISSLVVKSGDNVTTFVAGTDYEADLELGRLQILEGGGIDDGDAIVLSYTKAAASWDRVVTGAQSELTGALRIIADNATGADRDFYMPRVTLTPSGELPVIAEGTDFVQMEFGLEVLKPSNGEAIYVDGRPATP
ncbi:hypothetical protein [Niveibacterium sp. SC-1]|uniref:phage tail tube protein n=1 Tax=Niveibacterium sp. SC-1 TaxID=3135646 RepID=UPI00311E8C7E